ncbi:zinc-binding dehydrogenase [Myroides sp. LJL110]
MKATVINRFGQADKVFEQIELPKPTISEDEILVKIMATSINPIDYKIRSGELSHLISSFPAILHGDISGIVEQVGDKVTKFQKGQKVFGYVAGFSQYKGGLADYAVANPDLMAILPEDTNFTAGAALPLVGLTAYQMVFDKVSIQIGQKVLVYGATGGVGHLVVQFAKLCGAQVHAMVSNQEKAQIAKTLGADQTINYKEESIENILDKYTDGKGYDIVFDNVGNENLQNSFRLTKVNGEIVTTLALIPVDISQLHERALSLHVVYMITPLIYHDKQGIEKLAKILEQLKTWTEQGKIKPLISQIFTLDQVAQAHNYAENGCGTGKTVVIANKANKL